jgi:hypothetical protein
MRAVHDCSHVSRQRVHISAYVIRQVSRCRSSYFEHVDTNGKKCLNVSHPAASPALLFNLFFYFICRAIILAWVLIFTTAIPTAICHGEVEYVHKGENHTACLFLSEHGYRHDLFQVRDAKMTIIRLT